MAQPGALCNYINRVGWLINPQGFLLIAPGVDLHICFSDLRQIRSCLIFYWMQHVSQCGHDRATWRNAPVICRTSNHQLFRKTPKEKQMQLARELSGAYMTEDKIAEFSDRQSGACAVCGNDAGVEHQLLHCPATQDLREQFQDVVQFLQDYDPIHWHLPHHFVDEFWEFTLALTHNVAPVVFSPQHQQLIGDMVSMMQTPTFFTDGSCLHPEDATKRTASFAIVLFFPNNSDGTSATPLSLEQFRVIHMGRCQGRQVINRAELQAILGILENTTSAVIYTDSQYVVDLASRLRHLPAVLHLHKRSNFDLLHRLCIALKRGTYEVRKIKAHQTPNASHTDHERFCVMGNSLADETARPSAKRLVQQIHQHLLDPDDPQDALVLNKDRRWQYLLELKRVRATLVRAQQVEEVQSLGQTQNFFQWATNYTPTGEQWHPATFSDEQLEDISSCCMWGSEFALAFYHWCHTLIWKADGDQSRPYQTAGKVPLGISWPELVINFCIAQQQWVPTPIGGGKHADFRVQTFLFPEKVRQNSFSSMILALQSMSRFWDAVTGQSLLPRHELKDVRCLRYFGATGYSRGFAIRPQVQNQACTVQAVREYFKKGISPGAIGDLPDIPVVTPIIHFRIPMAIESFSAEMFTERFTKYRQKASQIRTAARRGGG